MVWPAPPDPPRIGLIGILDDSDDLRASRSATESLRALFRGPRPPIRFNAPHAIAVSDRNIVAVTDPAGACLHLLDLETREHRLVIGSEASRFGAPMGVAWSGHRLFMTDAKTNEVVELTAEGRVVHQFGSDRLTRPVGIAYSDARQRLYVVDGGEHRIASFDCSGMNWEQYGQRGSGSGEFNYPTHISVSRDRLLVADSGNFRAQMLDLYGIPQATIGQKGDGAGDFSLPKGVAMDQDGRIYVSDSHFENVQIFSREGRLLMALGREGSAPGSFVLPAGVAVDSMNRIWIADSGNKRLQVFEILGKRESRNVEVMERSAS